ncbi:protease modulator HflC [Neorhizobium sp. JUb45]|uniref:protease modulator HflC n=1 Tax=unclassified Neorhizobium TaxID=2629175 RepID=UPI0010540406|nr:protease modulator HflC [Neorhizobium sp. JUb45]TCR07072.1 protease FtsH subunit HflC [Neorhizobium sp. JUb45]
MVSNKLPAFLIALGVLLFIVYSSVFVVSEREQAIVIRFGEIQSVKSEPGLYMKLPFAFMDADRVQYIEKRALRLDLDNIRVQVSDGKFYDVDAFVVYRISDPRRFRETVSGDRASAESRLRTRLDSGLRRVYGLRGFEAALSEERVSMMTEIHRDLNVAAESLGVKIEDVRIRRTDLTPELSQTTFNLMESERLAEAELIRARGNEEAQRRRAIADRQVVELVSQASRDSEIIRGQGDAERNRIFGEAFSRDQQFFEFYRSMQAYGTSLGGAGTTMVLSPDSQFFRFFANPDGNGGQGPVRTAPAAPAAGGQTPAPANN